MVRPTVPPFSCHSITFARWDKPYPAIHQRDKAPLKGVRLELWDPPEHTLARDPRKGVIAYRDSRAWSDLLCSLLLSFHHLREVGQAVPRDPPTRQGAVDGVVSSSGTHLSTLARDPRKDQKESKEPSFELDDVAGVRGSHIRTPGQPRHTSMRSAGCAL